MSFDATNILFEMDEDVHVPARPNTPAHGFSNNSASPASSVSPGDNLPNRLARITLAANRLLDETPIQSSNDNSTTIASDEIPNDSSFQVSQVTHDNGYFTDSDTESESSTKTHTQTDRQTSSEPLNAYSISIDLPPGISTDDDFHSLLRATSTVVNYRIRTGNFSNNVPRYRPGYVALFQAIIPVATMDLVPGSLHAQFLHRLLGMWLDSMMGLQAWGVELSMPHLSAGQWALMQLVERKNGWTEE